MTREEKSIQSRRACARCVASCRRDVRPNFFDASMTWRRRSLQQPGPCEPNRTTACSTSIILHGLCPPIALRRHPIHALVVSRSSGRPHPQSTQRVDIDGWLSVMDIQHVDARSACNVFECTDWADERILGLMAEWMLCLDPQWKLGAGAGPVRSGAIDM